MNRASWITAAVVTFAGLCGCNLSNRGVVCLPPVAVPDAGGEISIRLSRYDVERKKMLAGPVAEWARPSQSAKELITVAPGEGSQSLHDYIGRVEPADILVSPDKNRVWLVHDSEVVASFDYDEGIAVLGTYAQPGWATVSSDKTEK